MKCNDSTERSIELSSRLQIRLADKWPPSIRIVSIQIPLSISPILQSTSLKIMDNRNVEEEVLS